MAGFSKVYFVGATGGFMGADGLARPFFQIMVGDGGRQWLEPVYDAESRAMGEELNREEVPRPMPGVGAIVPARPNDESSVLDATIAFFPALFRDCPSLKAVEAELDGSRLIDFDAGRNVPRNWAKLREEARARFAELGVFEAELQQINPPPRPFYGSRPPEST